MEKMQANPLVSVIMPAYNVEKYIEDSIQSVIKQTYTAWELIVIDDGSTDTSGTIVKAFAKDNKRIKYIYQPNKGQDMARNAGLEKAQGDIVAFLDSDDIWLPRKLEVSVAAFESADCDLLFTDAYIFYNSSELKDVAQLERIGVRAGIHEGEEALQKFFSGNLIPMLTVIARKDMFLKVDGFPHFRIGEDYYLWLRFLLEGYRFVSIGEPLSAYRMRTGSIMSEIDNESKEILDMMKVLSVDYPEIKTKYRKQIKHWVRMFIKYRLRDKNKEVLKEYFKFFNLYSLRIRAIFAIGKNMPLLRFRKLVKSVL